VIYGLRRGVSIVAQVSISLGARTCPLVDNINIRSSEYRVEVGNIRKNANLAIIDFSFSSDIK
jgi:hypothetical protein